MEISVFKKVVDLIYSSVISEGGDGDAYWLCKHISLDEVEVLLKSHNNHWEVKRERNVIQWGVDQEWATITVNKQKVMRTYIQETRIARTDSSNFHHCSGYCHDRKNNLKHQPV